MSIRSAVTNVVLHGTLGGATVHTAASTAPPNHTLLLGIISTIGVISAATVAGLFNYFSSKNRYYIPYDPTKTNADAIGDTPQEALDKLNAVMKENSELRQQLEERENKGGGRHVATK